MNSMFQWCLYYKIIIMLKHLTYSDSSPRTDLPLEIHGEKELPPTQFLLWPYCSCGVIQVSHAHSSCLGGYFVDTLDKKMVLTLPFQDKLAKSSRTLVRHGHHGLHYIGTWNSRMFQCKRKKSLCWLVKCKLSVLETGNVPEPTSTKGWVVNRRNFDRILT